MDTIHIIMPVYNVLPYLEDAIKSVINQTDKNFKLILVDDGSKDECATICDKYATEYDFISVIHKENGGVSSARNVALDSLIGEKGYVTFVDSDDMLLPTMVESVRAKIKETNADVVLYGMEIVVLKDGVEQARKIPENYDFYYNKEQIYQNLSLLLKNAMWDYCVDKVYKLDLINKRNIRFNSYLDISGEDAVFLYDLLPYVNTMAGISEIGYMYYMRYGQSMTKRFRPDLYEKNIYKTKILQNLLNEIGQKQACNKVLLDMFSNSIMWAYEQIFSPACNYSAKEKANYVTSTFKPVQIDKQTRKEILKSLNDNQSFVGASRITKFITKRILKRQWCLAKTATFGYALIKK